ncbi:hypothetical protein [uncultured Pontibacter sp.]|uniref:hypothetical protein n=1 Tax=uncultured Pontibacter sp. TaxID=453356 RepID=UPI002615CCC2|nr:hypothetical protein [uncultured Pontibacter sp.]
MIIVKEIRPAKTGSDWDVIIFSNKEDKYVKSATEAWGYIYEPKTAVFPAKKSVHKFEIGNVFDEKEIITKSSEYPFWEGQRYIGRGVYYKNFIEDIIKPRELAVELIKGFNDILGLHNIKYLYFKSKVTISGFLPKVEPLIQPLEILQLDYKVIVPDYILPDQCEGKQKRTTYVENVCLILGYKVKPSLMHLLTYLGDKVFENNSLQVIISYATYDYSDYGRVSAGQSDNCYFGINLYSSGDYTNLSAPISAKEFLDLDFTKLTSAQILELFPNIYPCDSGYIEYFPEDNYRDYSSINRENYEANRDAFDALTDGQYGDYDSSNDY